MSFTAGPSQQVSPVELGDKQTRAQDVQTRGVITAHPPPRLFPSALRLNTTTQRADLECPNPAGDEKEGPGQQVNLGINFYQAEQGQIRELELSRWTGGALGACGGDSLQQQDQETPEVTTTLTSSSSTTRSGPGPSPVVISPATCNWIAPSLLAAYGTQGWKDLISLFFFFFLLKIPQLMHFGFLPYCPQAFLLSGAVFFHRQLLEACYFSGPRAKLVFNFCSRWHSTLDPSAGGSNLSE